MSVPCNINKQQLVPVSVSELVSELCQCQASLASAASYSVPCNHEVLQQEDVQM